MEGSRYERVEWRNGNQGPLAIVTAVSSEGHTTAGAYRAYRYYALNVMSDESSGQNRTYRKATPPCLHFHEQLDDRISA